MADNVRNSSGTIVVFQALESREMLSAAPVVEALAASPGAIYRGQNVTLTATGVQDSDGTVASVAFYYDPTGSGVLGADSVLAGTDTDGSNGWSWTGNTSFIPATADGPTTFMAVATDNEALQSDAVASTPITVTTWSNTWTRGGVSVTAYDLLGALDMSASNFNIVWGAGNKVKSITITGTNAMTGLGLVVHGAGTIGTITDARTGTLGDFAFIAADAPVAAITVKGNMAGYAIDGQTWGGIWIQEADNDHDPADLTAFFLEGDAFGVSSVIVTGSVTVKGSVYGDIIANSCFRSLVVKGTVENVLIHTGGTVDPTLFLSMNLGTVRNTSVDSLEPLSTVHARSWTSTGDTLGQFVAPSIKTLTIDGALQVDMDLFDRDVTYKTSLYWATVKGPITGTWNLPAKAGTLTMGDATDWSLSTAAIKSLVLGNVTNGTVNSAGAIGKLTAKGFGGTITADSIRSLSLGAVTNATVKSLAGGIGAVTARKWDSGSITAGLISGGAPIVSLNLGVVGNLTVSSGNVFPGAIGAVTAKSWADGSISAKSIATIVTTVGNFGADVTVRNAAVSPVVTLIAGINIKGTLDSATIRSSGRIGSITAGAMAHSRIYAGVKDTVIDNADPDLWMPQASADYSSTLTSIGIVKVLGAGGFVDSILAAGRIGATTLHNVTTTNNKPLGLAATAITSLKTTGTWPGTWSATTWQNADRDQFTTIKIV